MINMNVQHKFSSSEIGILKRRETLHIHHIFSLPGIVVGDTISEGTKEIKRILTERVHIPFGKQTERDRDTQGKDRPVSHTHILYIYNLFSIKYMHIF